jgi:pimeloyl-ACP methyl ester carboxylesterase
VTPFLLGPTERRLFGILHRARSGATSSALLCSPYGPEAIRAHRVYRVLADRLVQRGTHVLRFDYYGTGDSAGDDAQGDLSGWVRDILTAHEALVQRTQPQYVTWLGTRLGAALALQASRAVARAPNSLVLWDAVVDGADYLQELRSRHAQSLEQSFVGTGYTAPAGSGNEALGYALGDGLRAELEALMPASCGEPRAVRCHVVDHGDARVAALAAKWTSAGAAVSLEQLEHHVDWLRQEALHSALVPAHAIERLAALLEPGA